MERSTDKMLLAMRRARKETPNLLEESDNKLSFDFFNSRVSNQVLVSSLFDGSVDTNGLNQMILDLRPVKERVGSEPSWRTLWHHFNMDKAEFESARDEFLADFVSVKITDPAEIIHSFGIILSLSEHRLIFGGLEEAYNICQFYLDDVSELLELSEDRLIERDGYGGADGLGFQGDKKLLLTLIEQLHNTFMTRKAEYESEAVRELLADRKIDVVALREELFGTTERSGASNLAVLHRISESNLFDEISELPIRELRDLAKLFSARVDEAHHRSTLHAEGKWYRQVKLQFLRAARKSADLRRWQLQMLIEGTFPSEKLSRYR